METKGSENYSGPAMLEPTYLSCKGQNQRSQSLRRSAESLAVPTLELSVRTLSEVWCYWWDRIKGNENSIHHAYTDREQENAGQVSSRAWLSRIWVKVMRHTIKLALLCIMKWTTLVLHVTNISVIKSQFAIISPIILTGRLECITWIHGIRIWHKG